MDIHTTVKLSSGHEMPLLGLGVFQIEDEDACRNAVRAALDCGYRHIDTAAVYENERSVGRAIAESDVDREDIFVTTKVFIRDFGPEKTRRAFEASRSKLDMDYVDLYLIHWPVDETMMGAWEAMQALRDEGKIRSIGVSNFTIRRFEESFLPRTDETPAVNQVEYHPFWDRQELRDYCHAKDIRLEGYSPLVRAQRMDNPVLKDVAAGHGKSVAQVLIRWQLQQQVVVIPKSSHADRIRENADVYDFELTDDDMRRLGELDEGLSVIGWRPSDDWY